MSTRKKLKAARRKKRLEDITFPSRHTRKGKLGDMSRVRGADLLRNFKKTLKER